MECVLLNLGNETESEWNASRESGKPKMGRNGAFFFLVSAQKIDEKAKGATLLSKKRGTNWIFEALKFHKCVEGDVDISSFKI